MRNDEATDINWHEVRRAAADAGINPDTLPQDQAARPEITRVRYSDGYELTDMEWQVISPHLNRSSVKPSDDAQDRAFINACIGKARNLPWASLLKGSTARCRFRRWAELAWWAELEEALRDDESLSKARRKDFRDISEAADRLCARVEKVRDQRR